MQIILNLPTQLIGAYYLGNYSHVKLNLLMHVLTSFQLKLEPLHPCAATKELQSYFYAAADIGNVSQVIERCIAWDFWKQFIPNLSMNRLVNLAAAEDA